MIFKRSIFPIQDKNEKDLENEKEFPTLADLMREQKVTKNQSSTVHYRRDLDSLG